MRISDWSSDVCSSDLDPHRAAPDGAQRQEVRRRRGIALDRDGARAAIGRARLDGEAAPAVAPHLHAVAGHPVEGDLDIGLGNQLEIGRASCRESVCQYVSISVGGVTLKKKQSN